MFQCQSSPWCSLWVSMVEQRSPCCLEASCDPKLDGAGSWQELQSLEMSPHRVRAVPRPHGDSSWSSLFLRNCTLWRGPTLEEDCFMWLGTHAGAREDYEEEETAQTCKN